MVSPVSLTFAVAAAVGAGRPRASTCVTGDATTVEVRGPDAPARSTVAVRLLATIAVLQLVDRGIVRLDEPIRAIVPAFCDGPFGRPATVAHALFHAVGLSPRGIATGDLARDLARHGPTRREPGRLVEPSPLGDELLAGIVERTTGRPFSAYVDENLFGPMGVEARWSRDGGRWVVTIRSSQLARLAQAIVGLGTAGGVALWTEHAGRALLAPPGGLDGPPRARMGGTFGLRRGGTVWVRYPFERGAITIDLYARRFAVGGGRACPPR